MTTVSNGLSDFGLSRDRGFLPSIDPLDRLPSHFDAWEHAAYSLPKLMMSDNVRAHLEALPPFDVSQLTQDAQIRRAMMILSYIGHAYVWAGKEPASTLPANIAVPWHAVATLVGRPPVLSYASYAHDNWYRLDPQGDVLLGNIGLLQNFLGGQDEEWFILIHVDIEHRAAPALSALQPAQEAVRRDDSAELKSHLGTLKDSLEGMYATMTRMPERCDPYIYYQRVRPYIHGWKNHPDLPDGLVYEGVEAYGGVPQKFRGETGAQSSIIPAFDALLGVEHENDILKTYLMEMREYMPPRHRAFIESIEAGPSVRAYVQSHGDGELKDVYNACVELVERFRSLHLEYAAKYIFHQAQTDPKNPSKVGTGGTPFMKYLKKHRDETGQQKLA